MAEGGLASSKARERIRTIERDRAEVEARLTTINDDLGAGAELIRGWLKLLANPYELYVKASNEMRRMLNQAIFAHIWVIDADRVEAELSEPARLLVEAQRHWAGLMVTEDETRPTLDSADANSSGTVEDLLDPMDWALVSSKRSMVPPTGIEPATFGTGNQRSIP